MQPSVPDIIYNLAAIRVLRIMMWDMVPVDWRAAADVLRS